MAQKQFKIGLSNQDKQNMAQDVYERLLALTFPEYETTTEYEVGDFVVYNDKLYKCIGATSGAWDSTKWQLATLNDLLTDIENAVAFVNDKANVNGNYPTMTVGFADNLTPYDESAGDDQDEPFSFQATGTGNGTQPDFATGSGALMKEKQGNTVVVNQKISGIVATKTVNGVTFTNNSDGTMTINGTASAEIGTASSGEALSEISWFARRSHYSLVSLSNENLPEGFIFGVSGYPINKRKSFIFYETNDTDWDGRITCHILEGTVINNLKVRPFVIDLTQWFNGDIPQDILDNPSNFFRYYQGSLAYNEGELVNADGRYIKCIGMNQWDEEWELGKIDYTNGNLESDATRIRCKNFIEVLPNTTYYCKAPIDTALVYAYDKDKNYIGGWTDGTGWRTDGIQFVSNHQFTTPANCSFVKIACGSTYGTTYNNDISINLYYEDEPRCLTYEPYQVLTNNDTGNEVLRSAGSVKDSKTPDGTITRRIGVVDLGTLTWILQGSGIGERFESTGVASLMKTIPNNTTLPNFTCSKYEAKTWSVVGVQDIDKFITQIGGGNNRIAIRDTNYNDAAAFKTAMSGVYLFYELAEPTTEQGTPYSENLVIDDFGSMDFGSDVPQGALIFYPVDYKAFIDTLYKYTDGTPSELVKQSERTSDKSAQATLDTALQNAIGGTLRQCLCVKESLDFDNTDFVDLGELNWVASSYTGLFYADFTANSNGYGLSTKYKNKGIIDYTQMDNKTIQVRQTIIYIQDNTYTDATAFKNAMKGVLLAYEKASE